MLWQTNLLILVTQSICRFSAENVAQIHDHCGLISFKDFTIYLVIIKHILNTHVLYDYASLIMESKDQNYNDHPILDTECKNEQCL